MQGYAPPRLRQIIAEAVFRRRSVVLSTFVIVVGLVLLGTVFMHKRYESKAKLLVQNVRTAAQLTTSSVDHLVSQGDVSPAEINTEVDLLESDGVAGRALAQIHGTLRPDQQGKAVQRFRGLMSVQAVHQTDIIDVAMLGGSPQEAQKNLQALIDAYFEERAGTARNSGAAEFFSAQLQQKSKQLDADQAALTAFQMQHGIADLEDQTKLQVARVSALQDDLAKVDANLAALQSKMGAEQIQLSSTPARSQTQIRTITNQYTQERLNTSLVDLQNRRSELLQRYVPSDRQVLEIDDKIATTRKAINEATAHPAGEEATDVNPVWAQLTTLVATSGSEISGMTGQRNALVSQIASAEERLRDLEGSTTGYGDLRRKLQQSQNDYALYAQRRDEARISEALDRQKLFNVAVLQGPITQSDPIRPKPFLYLLTATVFGLLLGTSFAVYADLAGGQVHTPSQLDAWTGVRTLATLADEAAGDWTAQANRRQYRRVLFGMRQAVDGARALSAGSPDWMQSAADRRPTPQPPFNDTQGLCVAFTSALQGEGVSSLVRHIATEASQQASQRVAVLDTRRLIDSFEAEQSAQLPMEFEPDAEHWVLAKQDQLAPSSPAAKGARGHLASRLATVLQQARSEFDLILLDCPSMQTSMLAGELAPCIDGYVAVVRAGAARKQNIEDLASQLSSTRAPTLGYVLTRRHYPVPRWLHRLI